MQRFLGFSLQTCGRFALRPPTIGPKPSSVRIPYSATSNKFARQPALLLSVSRFNSSTNNRGDSGGSSGNKSGNSGSKPPGADKNRQAGRPSSSSSADTSRRGPPKKSNPLSEDNTKFTKNNPKSSSSSANSHSWTENLKQAARKMTDNLAEQVKSHMPAGGQQHHSTVVHEHERSRFVMDLGNNQQARIDYKKRTTTSNKSAGDQQASNKKCCPLYDLFHTEVPQELRGKGIGQALAKQTLDQLRAEGAKVKLSCSYLQHVFNQLGENNKYASMIERGPSFNRQPANNSDNTKRK